MYNTKTEHFYSRFGKHYAVWEDALGNRCLYVVSRRPGSVVVDQAEFTRFTAKDSCRGDKYVCLVNKELGTKQYITANAFYEGVEECFNRQGTALWRFEYDVPSYTDRENEYAVNADSAPAANGSTLSATTPSDDALWGEQQIADYVGLTKGQVHHRLQAGTIPAKKLDHSWVASKEALRKWWREHIVDERAPY